MIICYSLFEAEFSTTYKGVCVAVALLTWLPGFYVSCKILWWIDVNFTWLCEMPEKHEEEEGG